MDALAAPLVIKASVRRAAMGAPVSSPILRQARLRPPVKLSDAVGLGTVLGKA
jgi:hypothetical protein